METYTIIKRREGADVVVFNFLEPVICWCSILLFIREFQGSPFVWWESKVRLILNKKKVVPTQIMPNKLQFKCLWKWICYVTNQPKKWLNWEMAKIFGSKVGSTAVSSHLCLIISKENLRTILWRLLHQC